MPVSKSADRYRGKMRLRDRLIKELTLPKTTVVAGVWPDDPVSALAEWCADTLIVPSGHPLAGQPMALPWYIRDFLRDALAPCHPQTAPGRQFFRGPQELPAGGHPLRKDHLN